MRSVKDEVWEQALGWAEHRVWGQVQGGVPRQIQSRFFAPVWDRVWNGAWNRVEDRVWNEVTGRA